MDSRLEVQERNASNTEVDVDGRAGDRSSAQGLEEAGRRDRPVHRVAGTNHYSVVGAGEVAGADGIAEATGAGGCPILPGVRGAGVEGDRHGADGAQREVDGRELSTRRAWLDLAGQPEARVFGSWRLNRLARGTRDAINQRRSSGGRLARRLWSAQQHAQRGFASLVK